MADAYTGSGAGTEASPYLITTYAQLCEMMTCLNRLSSFWKLTTNIDASASSILDYGKGWTPVGDDTNQFNGGFDGNSKTITGLFIDRPTTLFIGLFGTIGTKGKIQNVGLVTVDITGMGRTGGLCGKNWGIISNCYCTGTLEATAWVTAGTKAGGFVGLNMGTISNSYSTVTVTQAVGATNVSEVGGFCGNNAGKISQCYSTGSVTAYRYVGGFCGHNEGYMTIIKAVISNCYCTGAVTGTLITGGFCGDNYNQDYPSNAACIINCYSTGAVTCTTQAGGFVGYYTAEQFGIIGACFYDYQTSGKTDDNGGSLHETTAVMKTQTTFTDAGWDFTTPVWTITADAYPVFITASVPITKCGYSGAGLGTEASPYLITTYAQLCEMQTIGACALAAFWKLANDIDASASSSSKWIGSDRFTGSFDGNNHTISNLYIEGQATTGFFGRIISLFGCKNLTLSSPNITSLHGGPNNAADWGVLSGSLESGTIENCFVISPIMNFTPYYSNNVIGAFCGENHGTIKNCSATNISLTNLTSNSWVGGFIGFHYTGIITNCYCTGNIIGVTNNIVGGFAGNTGKNANHHNYNADSIFYNCYAAVTMTNGDKGFCGVNGGGTITFTSCYYDTTLSGLTDTGLGEPKTTAQLKQPITFAGWNFTEIWAIVTGVSAPTLIGE